MNNKSKKEPKNLKEKLIKRMTKESLLLRGDTGHLKRNTN